MSFDKVRRFSRTLSFRLSLWYGLVFSLLSCLAFVFFYVLITTDLRQRLDDHLSEKISEFEAIYNLQGIEEVKTAALTESQAAGEKKVFFRLLYASGVAFSSSNMSYWREIGLNREAVGQLMEGRSRVYETLSIPGRPDRIRIAYGKIGRGVLLQLGYSMENDSAYIRILKKIFIITMIALIATAGLVGWFMAKRALSGVEAVTRTARQISESDLSRRVPVMARHEEIDRLAVTFNQMLDRIEKLVAGVREMGDNIAHDLKSPVARIRGMAEISLTVEPEDADEDMTLAGRTIEECDRLLEMINTMLMISKTDAGVQDLAMEPVNLAAEVKNAVALFAPLAEDKGIQFQCNISDPLIIRGDLKLLQRAISNIVDNAIKYTSASGKIDICAYCDNFDHKVNISITDNGIGISDEDLPKIFTRFFRCDQSRATEGSGLGLSLVRSVVHAHGGTLRVESKPGVGSTFTLTLPLMRSSDELVNHSENTL